MARPHVLLCGNYNDRRFEEFWAAGFSVDHCESEYDLVRWLLYGKVTDLICVVEAEDRPLEQELLEHAKSYSDVPLVLFRAANRLYRQGLWSLEVHPWTAPAGWLRGILDLMARRRPDGETLQGDAF